MSTYTLALGPSRWDAEQILNEDRFISLSGALQSENRTGSRWRLVLTYLNLTGTRRRTMQAFAFNIMGTRHRAQVNMSTLGYTRAGAGGGTPLLVGAHTAGTTTIAIDGATTVANWLVGGDFISIGNELKIVTQSVTTVATAGTISIWPELHQNRADNFAIDIATPKGVFFMAGPTAISGQPFPSDWLNESLVLSLEEDVVA